MKTFMELKKIRLLFIHWRIGKTDFDSDEIPWIIHWEKLLLLLWRKCLFLTKFIGYHKNRIPITPIHKGMHLGSYRIHFKFIDKYYKWCLSNSSLKDAASAFIPRWYKSSKNSSGFTCWYRHGDWILVLLRFFRHLITMRPKSLLNFHGELHTKKLSKTKIAKNQFSTLFIRRTMNTWKFSFRFSS